MTSDEAIEKIAEYTRQLGMGGYMISEKTRDWLISRQRYWGTPIPLVHCPEHGGNEINRFKKYRRFCALKIS